MTETIYMPLLDEGVAVWRPVPAHRIAPGTYIVLRPADYDDADEHWQFPPGCVVFAADRDTADGTVTVAVALAPDARQSA